MVVLRIRLLLKPCLTCAAELAAAQYLLSSCSSFCFRIKIVHNCGLWGAKKIKLHKDLSNFIHLSLTESMRHAAELAAALHLLSSFSSPCFSIKIVFNCGIWGTKRKLHKDDGNFTHLSLTESMPDMQRS
jgi:hypothetical protein